MNERFWHKARHRIRHGASGKIKHCNVNAYRANFVYCAIKFDKKHNVQDNLEFFAGEVAEWLKATDCKSVL